MGEQNDSLNCNSIGSFEQLETAIKRYEEVNYVTLYKRSSRTIEAARKRAPNRHFATP